MLSSTWRALQPKAFSRLPLRGQLNVLSSVALGLVLRQFDFSGLGKGGHGFIVPTRVLEAMDRWAMLRFCPPFRE
jgi:hypothetical protein